MPTAGLIVAGVLVNAGLLVVLGMMVHGFVRRELAARPNLSTRITKGAAQAALDEHARRTTRD